MSSKQKNRVLFIGLIILFLVAYQFSFKKTFELRASVEKLTADKLQLENAGGKLRSLQQQNRYLDSILDSNNVSADQSFRQNLLQKVDELRDQHKVKIVSLEKPHEFKGNAATTESYTIEVKGDFRNLMLFSSNLEKQRLGKLSSVDFTKKTNYKTRRKELFCRIILQRLTK
jgi:hypothetical protein